MKTPPAASYGGGIVGWHAGGYAVRLEDQISWYDRKSGDSQRRYKWLKLLEIAVAASLPVVAAVHSPVWVTGGLAALIVVLEAVQHLYQFQEHWITYRSTAEACVLACTG